MSVSKKIPFFDYQFFYRNYRDDMLATMDDVLKRGAFIMQQDILDFENQLASYLGAKHVISVGNCTDGLEMALYAAGIGKGDEVIFPSHTFVATAGAIKANQATPVPVECGKDHLMDPASIEQAITSKTKAIMPVQLNGRTCDMDAIQAIADKHKLLIVEDAAQGLGSTFKGKKAGTFGLAAAMSFYPAKILGCLGDGGIVITSDDKMADQIRLLRDHGRGKDGLPVQWGRNSRLDNLQAAILNRLFKDYEHTISHRRKLAAAYHSQLSSIKNLHLPPAPDTNPDHFDVFQNYEIECDHRDQLASYLDKQGVGTLKQWGGKAVHQMPGLGFTQHLPATEQMIARALLLPMNLSLNEDDIHYICKQIEGFYQNEVNEFVSIAS